jgi:hypothetical protein
MRQSCYTPPLRLVYYATLWSFFQPPFAELMRFYAMLASHLNAFDVYLPDERTEPILAVQSSPQARC